MAAQSDLTGTVERYLAAAATDRAGALRTLTAAIRQAIRDGATEATATALQRAVLPSLDYTSLQSLYRLYKALPEAVLPKQKFSLALLGSFTTTQLAQAIELALFAQGVAVELREADYGVYRQEILDPTSPLYEFAPKMVFLATSWRDLIRRPTVASSRQEVRDLVAAEVADWAALWRTAHQRLGCQILQNNFDRPAYRQLDNHESRQPGGLGRFIGLVNETMADERRRSSRCTTSMPSRRWPDAGSGATSGSSTMPSCRAPGVPGRLCP